MREPVRDRDRLIHILTAIDRILEFSNGKTVETIVADTLKFYGIIKNIEIIGEAAYKLTKAFQTTHPEIPWAAISKMRHVLVHDYYQIDSDQIIGVIKEDLGPLRDQISSYIDNTNWHEWEMNDLAISESAVHKSLVQTAVRMKNDGLPTEQIIRYTGLSLDEIKEL